MKQVGEITLRAFFYYPYFRVSL